ncbi:MAG TPA: DMT family transporter [Vicinamibacteria bacterium]|nr:DMT family transporter [Vicinamibacteria bacterium]
MTAASRAGRPAADAYLSLGAAVACISVGSILVRLAQAPALATAFYRVGLATLLVATFAVPALWRSAPGLSRGQLLALSGSGVALGVHFATWIASLSFTSVAASVLLVNTAPLFTLALARVVLGETVSGAVVAAMALALVGALLIAVGDWDAGSLKGDALAVAGAVTLSLYHVAGRGLREALPLRAYILGVWGTAALTIGAFALVASVPFTGYAPRTVLLFVALAVVPTLLGHGLVNRSLRRLPAPTVGLFMLGEPVAAGLLAYAIFGERPGGWALAGGAVILAALAVVAAEPRR